LTEAEVSENLVGRIIEGDQQAEQDMVLRYQRGLGVMLYNRARDHALASDIAQDTWLLVIEKVRSRQLRNLVDTKNSPEKAFVDGQLSQCVARLLDELTVDRDKHILRRFYLVGDDKDELCKEFDLTPAHFDRVLYRARERFKVLWEESAGSKYV